MDDLNNEKLTGLLHSLSEKCVEAFDQYLAKQPEPETEAKVPEAETTKPAEETAANGDGHPAADDDATTTTTAAPATEEVKVEIVAPPKLSNVEQLIAVLTEWKKANSSDEERRQNNRNRNNNRNQKKAPRPGPNEEKLKEILQRTGYSHEVSSGQRKYGGPPPNWPPATSDADKKDEIQQPQADVEEAAKPAENGHTEETPMEASGAAAVTTGATAAAGANPALLHPGAGCECFVGKLPRDLFEDELIPVFEKQGRIWDLRLMIDPTTGFSKGYCFVTYCDKESAAAAAKAVSWATFMCLLVFILIFFLQINNGNQ